jgi:hypothetical protein
MNGPSLVQGLFEGIENEAGRFYQRDIGVTWIRYLAGSAEGRVFRAC